MDTGVNEGEVKRTANAHVDLANSVKIEVQKISQRTDQLSAESKSKMTIALAEAAHFFKESVGKGVVQDLNEMSDIMQKAASGQVSVDEQNASVGRTDGIPV